MIQFVAVGAVGALVWTGWKAFRREMDRLEREEENAKGEPHGTLSRDDDGRYRLRRDSE